MKHKTPLDLDLPTLLKNMHRAFTEEKPRVRLSSFTMTICNLRDKRGFTYRQIASWMNGFGVPCSHNGVYHVYKQAKGLK